MSKKKPVTRVQAEGVVGELGRWLVLSLGSSLRDKLVKYVESNLASSYYRGYSDGLAKAREIYFSDLTTNNEGVMVKREVEKNNASF